MNCREAALALNEGGVCSSAVPHAGRFLWGHLPGLGDEEGPAGEVGGRAAPDCRVSTGRRDVRFQPRNLSLT